MGPLGKLHNIIIHSRSSSHRTKQFESFVGRRIPLDNRTRWNSWWIMLNAATQHESGIDQYTKTHLEKLSDDFLYPSDWTELRTIQQFLQPFYRATMDLQGYRSSLGDALFTMDVLIKHMNNAFVRIYFLLLTTLLIVRY
jgi:hypothetical protein